MKWIQLAGMGLVAIIALIGLLLAVGMAMPVEHTATSEAVFAAPIDTVWSTMTSFRDAPQWRRDLQRVELLPAEDGMPRLREHGANGAMTFEIETFEPPTRLVMRIVDEGPPFGGAWTYELQPEGSGTRLRITEDGEVYSALFRVVGRYLIGYTATMEAYLRDLSGRLEEPAPSIVSTVEAP